MYLIQAEGLRKVYRIRQRDGNWLKSMFSSRRMTVEALRSVSFSIREGELIGYIGPNGAGKSTTVKLLSGILTPDGGTCSVLGLTPWSQRRQLAGKIGVVFGERERESQKGTVYTVTDATEMISVEDVKNGKFKVPEKKRLQRAASSAGFTPLDDVDNGDLPF